MIDVLFILVFAALAGRAESAKQKVEPEPRSAPSASDTRAPVVRVEPDVATVARSASDFESVSSAGVAAARDALQGRPVVVVRVSEAGEITAIDTANSRHTIRVPLLERVADPDVALTYLGDRSPELRACAVAARTVDIAGRLVIVKTAKPLAELRVALVRGLRRDVERCTGDDVVAALVEQVEQVENVNEPEEADEKR